MNDHERVVRPRSPYPPPKPRAPGTQPVTRRVRDVRCHRSLPTSRTRSNKSPLPSRRPIGCASCRNRLRSRRQRRPGGGESRRRYRRNPVRLAQPTSTGPPRTRTGWSRRRSSCRSSTYRSRRPALHRRQSSHRRWDCTARPWASIPRRWDPRCTLTCTRRRLTTIPPGSPVSNNPGSGCGSGSPGSAARRPQTPVLDPLFRVVRANHPKADLALIERAYRTAER